MVNGIGTNKAGAGSATGRKSSVLQLTVAPERIHFLKFILEGYDGLAILSTVDVSQGLVEIRFAPEVAEELENLLHSIKPQIASKKSPGNSPS